MRFCSAVSEHEATESAVEQVIRAVETQVSEIDVLFVFLTAHHRAEGASIVASLEAAFDPQCLIGCSAEGVIGAESEVERAPGLAVLAGHMPGVRMQPFRIALEEWRPMLSSPVRLAERAGFGSETRAVIGFGDPFTTPLNQLLPALDGIMPGAPLIGGLASSARTAGENILILNEELLTEGFVGVSLSGPLEVDTIVSQGCRPIGHTMVITKAHDNVIEQLGGKPPLEALRHVVDEMDESERSLLSNGLMIGRAISEYKERFGRGDFLVRNLMGVDQNNGSIAVADYVRVGQTIQFHVRDAQTADEDLALMLQSQSINEAPAGGLLFSCNGRGTQLFDQPCHDIKTARHAMPKTPMAGFFAAGELGPVGGKNFVHGHTASLALFRPAR